MRMFRIRRQPGYNHPRQHYKKIKYKAKKRKRHKKQLLDLPGKKYVLHYFLTRPETKEVVCCHVDTEMPAESEAEKAERKAAVRAKIRTALLSAAAGQVEGGMQGPKLNVGKTDPRRLSTPGMMTGGGAKDVPKDLRRRSASGLQQEKPKETIWEFFE
jgi:hypothetical protein